MNHRAPLSPNCEALAWQEPQAQEQQVLEVDCDGVDLAPVSRWFPALGHREQEGQPLASLQVFVVCTLALPLVAQEAGVAARRCWLRLSKSRLLEEQR